MAMLDAQLQELNDLVRENMPSISFYGQGNIINYDIIF
jgi:hypothetical protein